MIKCNEGHLEYEGDIAQITLEFMHILDVILEEEPEIVLACFKARTGKMAKKLPTCNKDTLMLLEMVTSILDEKKKGE